MRLKTTSKEKQKEYITHLQKLFEDPTTLIPECVDGGIFCNFNTYRKKVSSVEQSGSFDKFSKTTDQFLSGISETYRILDSDSAPIFGMMKTPYGSIEYAKRGNTDENVLVGIQHYDSPIWRMLAFSSLVKSKGVRVYSSTNYYIGSCRNSSPGLDFFKDVLKDENIKFEEKDGEIEIPGSGHYIEVLHLNTVLFRFYENSSYNLLHSLLKHMLTPDIGADFSFKSDFLSEIVSDIPQQALNIYISGKMNDRTFIREVKDYRVSEAIKRGYYVVGNTSYTSPEDFISNNDFKYVNSEILVEALNRFGKGLYMDSFSERKVLESIWSVSGKYILGELFPDLDDSALSSLKGSPIDQIEGVLEQTRIAGIKSDIEFKAWSPDSQFLIDVLKTYFTLGKERAIREAEKSSGGSNVKKAIFYTLLDCLGEAKNREWQFTDTERDLSWKIKPYVSNILEKGSEVLADEMENIRVFIR